MAERGVSPEAVPSQWNQDDQRIVLEVLKEFLEGKAYAASGETVPERVLREIGDLIADIRKRVNNKFPAATDPEPEVPITDIMYGLYTTLIKWGVPEEAMQRIGEVMAEEAEYYPEFTGVTDLNDMGQEQLNLYLDMSERAVRQVA